MANTWKDIIITPNSDTTNDPKVEFRGANGSINTTITLSVYPTSNGTVSFEGSDGQLFSISNDLQNVTWSATDMSGIVVARSYGNGDMTIIPTGGNLFINGTTVTGVANTSEYNNEAVGHLLVADQVWNSGHEVGLTDAATIAVDLSTGINFNVSLGASRALGNPTSAKPGQSGYIRISYGGAYTLSYGNKWKFTDGITPTSSSNTSASDFLFYTVKNDLNVFATLATSVPA